MKIKVIMNFNLLEYLITFNYFHLMGRYCIFFGWIQLFILKISVHQPDIKGRCTFFSFFKVENIMKDFVYCDFRYFSPQFRIFLWIKNINNSWSIIFVFSHPYNFFFSIAFQCFSFPFRCPFLLVHFNNPQIDHW